MFTSVGGQGTGREETIERIDGHPCGSSLVRRQLVSRLENGKLGGFEESSVPSRRIGQGGSSGAV